MKKLRTNLEQGFTLAELVMALAIFSFMFMIVIAGFIQVTKIYEAGISARATQQNARLILDDFSKLARNSGAAVVVPIDATHSRVCLVRGSSIYEYYVDGSNNIWQGRVSDISCSAPTGPLDSSWRKINDSTVQVVSLQASSTPASGLAQGTVSINLTAASTYDVSSVDLANPKKIVCSGSGSQYCSVTTLFTTVALSGGASQ
jgi:prepilin-type N-terminal cleavage/methylation domain-containing protein